MHAGLQEADGLLGGGVEVGMTQDDAGMTQVDVHKSVVP